MKNKVLYSLWVVFIYITLLIASCSKDTNSIQIDFNEIENNGDENAEFTKYPIVRLTINDKNFEEVFYEKGGIKFYGKYTDYGFFGPDTFFIYAFDVENSYDKIGKQIHSSFTGNYLLLAEADVKIDFTGIGFSNKLIEFDVATEYKNFDQENEFAINSYNKETGPNGAKTKILPTEKGCHVTISGNVSDIIWFGEFTGYDNLKVIEL